jgi:IS30 family transposase
MVLAGNGPELAEIKGGTDLSVYDADVLARVAASLHNRPRQTLGYNNPSEKFTELESVWP